MKQRDHRALARFFIRISIAVGDIDLIHKGQALGVAAKILSADVPDHGLRFRLMVKANAGYMGRQQYPVAIPQGRGGGKRFRINHIQDGAA